MEEEILQLAELEESLHHVMLLACARTSEWTASLARARRLVSPVHSGL